MLVLVRTLRHAPMRILAVLVLSLLPLGCGEGEQRDGPVLPVGVTEPYDLDGVPRQTPPAVTGRPNVILVALDSLRADALDLAAEGPGRMPNLAALARRGVAFSQAAAAAPSTVASMASTLTGVLPHAHGVGLGEGPPLGLHPIVTWAEVLGRGLEYETLALVGAAWPSGTGSMLEGFDQVFGGRNLGAASDALEVWSSARPKDKPFFLLLHSQDARAPYVERPTVPAGPRAPDPVAALGSKAPIADVVRRSYLEADFHDALSQKPEHAALRRSAQRFRWSGLAAEPRPELTQALHEAYLEGVRRADALLGRTLDVLQRAGMLDNTLLVVMGDHGEAFGEHGVLGHGGALHEEQVRVPLVVVGPKGSPLTGGRVLDGSVGLVDLMPTCLDLLGLPTPGGMAGRSLLPLCRGETGGHPVVSVSKRTSNHTGGLSEGNVLSVRNHAWKVIITYDRLAGTVLEEGYDLLTDPQERRNLANADGHVVNMSFDVPFCATVESLRDSIWETVQGAHFMLDNGYEASIPYVKGTRPPRACTVETPRR